MPILTITEKATNSVNSINNLMENVDYEDNSEYEQMIQSINEYGLYFAW